MMPKSDIITAIMRINRGANADFLARFSNEDLTEYLQRLHALPGTDRCIMPAQPLSLTAPAVDDSALTLQVRWM